MNQQVMQREPIPIDPPLDFVQYGDVRPVNLVFEEAVLRLQDSLKSEGFGVLFEIDMQAKLREKLGVEFPKYVVLGVCNPPIAYQALQKDINLGLLLPCNAVVYERLGKVMVGAVDAVRMLAVTGHPELEESARQVNEKLRRALDSLAPVKTAT